MRKLSVFGAGAWGTAVALVLARNPANRVCLWCARPEQAEAVRGGRENTRYLPGVPVPETVTVTADPDEALADASLWVVAVPTVHLRSTLRAHAGRFRVALRRADVPVLSLAKGVENETWLRPTEILCELTGCTRVAVLSGPSHAEEVARELPTTVVVAGSDPGLSPYIQQIFTGDRFRVYTSPDLKGVELGGALKNVIGIAAGIGDGLGYGDNAKSALMTRGLVEMARFGSALGAEYQTFFGLAGLGDLVTTCISRHGRNRRVGERLARGESLDLITASTPTVAEGVYTARSVYCQAAGRGIDMPITTAVYRVLYEGKSPASAVDELMRREPRGETLF